MILGSLKQCLFPMYSKFFYQGYQDNKEKGIDDLVKTIKKAYKDKKLSTNAITSLDKYFFIDDNLIFETITDP
jgi:hypothetical protein